MFILDFTYHAFISVPIYEMLRGISKKWKEHLHFTFIQVANITPRSCSEGSCFFTFSCFWIRETDVPTHSSYGNSLHISALSNICFSYFLWAWAPWEQESYSRPHLWNLSHPWKFLAVKTFSGILESSLVHIWHSYVTRLWCMSWMMCYSNFVVSK